MIPLTPCKSSGIKATGYDPASKTLAVEFGSGVYHHVGVEPELAAELQSAESIGKFYASKIKGAFPATKQPSPEPEEE